jgi:hypothetical protein
MAIPTIKDVEIPLLHLIHTLGGEVSPSDTFDSLADFFKLSEKERRELVPGGTDFKFRNMVRWARNSLCNKGFLDRSVRGVWKITAAGIKELSRLALLDKPFSSEFRIPYKREPYRRKRKDDLISQEDQELIQMVIDEVIPGGSKDFPGDFSRDDSELYEIEVPGTELHINPHSKTLVTSPKGYFRHQAKNPPEAKYIVYANKIGQKKIKIPKDNLSIFRAVTSYEKYVTDTIKRSFELFLDFTYDEYRAEQLTQIVKEKLGLKEKIEPYEY